MDSPFDAAERTRILDEYRSIVAETLPENRRSVGCALLIFTLPILVLVPKVLPDRFAGIALIVGALMAIAGALFLLFGASAHYRAVDERAFGALDTLANRFQQATPDERRRAALYALAYAFHSDGPTTRSVYDHAEQKARLGESLEYVQAVERVLLEAGVSYPVFTT